MIVDIPGVGAVEFPDGTPDDVINKALSAYATPQPAAPNPDGTYGQAPEGMFANPDTGQMTSRELMQGNVAPSQPRALGTGLMQGLGFGFGDEAIGALGSLEGGADMGNLRREQARAMIEADGANNPWMQIGGKVAGGALSSLMLARMAGAAAPAVGLGTLAKNTGLGAQVVKGLGIGATEGGLYGAGESEGLAGRLGSARNGALVGGAVGGAAPVAISLARNLGDKFIGGPIASMRSAPSEVRASSGVMTALQRSGKSADDIANELAMAAREGQDRFAIADALGNPGQRMLAGVSRTPGDGRREIVESLVQRQDSQGERVGAFLSDALGATETAAQRTAALKAARGTAADAAYEAARTGANPVDVRSALSVIDDRIGGMQGSGVAGDGIDGILAKYRGRLAAHTPPAGTTGVELSDFDRVLGVKQSLQDDIGTAIRAGRNNEARELGKLQDALDQALEGASDGYRAANDGFREASKVIGSVDDGLAATRPTARSADVLQQYRAMSPEQQAAFNVGYGDKLIGRVESAAPGVNKVRPLTSDKTAAELAAMAKDPALLQRQIGRENTMFETARNAMGGSQTADNLADAAETTGFDMGALGNILTGRWGAAAQQAVQSGANAMMGRNTATRQLLAQHLLSKDIKAALEPALKSKAKAATQNKLIEALVRGLAVKGSLN